MKARPRVIKRGGGHAPLGLGWSRLQADQPVYVQEQPLMVGFG